jgi:hypothetical protein
MVLTSSFTGAAQTRIEVAEITAGIEFARRNTNLVQTIHGNYVIDYVMAVVLAFGKEACAQAKYDIQYFTSSPFPGPYRTTRWDVQRAKRETREFLETFASQAFSEKIHRDITTNSGIEHEVLDLCLGSPQWIEFQERLLELAVFQEKYESTPHFIGDDNSCAPPIQLPSLNVPLALAGVPRDYWPTEHRPTISIAPEGDEGSLLVSQARELHDRIGGKEFFTLCGISKQSYYNLLDGSASSSVRARVREGLNKSKQV